MARAVRLIVFASVVLPPFFSSAQVKSPPPSQPTRIFGKEDKDVLPPAASFPLGRKDDTALQLLASFITQNNLSNWPGIQADGIFTDSVSSNPAVLTILKDNQCRLDVTDPRGIRSIRIHGPSGTIQESNGSKHTLPAATASAGIFVLPQLVAQLAETTTSVIDGGLVTVDGNPLHRITFEMPAISSQDSVAAIATRENVSLVDLYFDPGTHQLLKSVASVRLDSKDRAYYLQAITYGDYRKVDGVMIPHSFTQTLNGQRQWTLQLTNPRISPVVNSSSFHF
jgi:hypothetical protein